MSVRKMKCIFQRQQGLAGWPVIEIANMYWLNSSSLGFGKQAFQFFSVHFMPIINPLEFPFPSVCQETRRKSKNELRRTYKCH